MMVFLTLLLQIIPLYILILFGFLGGKFLKAQKETLASILIYIIAPVVVFHGVTTTSLTPNLLWLPVIFFIISSSLCLLFYFGSKPFFHDSTRNILAFAAATGNTGYFGYPLVIALLGKEFLGIAVIANFGLMFFENSVGFFVTARGRHTIKESLLRLIKLPTLYAFLAGLLLNILEWTAFTKHSFYETFTDNFVGAYTVLGMMLIGLGLSELENFRIDGRFTFLAFFSKFLLWPSIMIEITTFTNTFQWFSPQVTAVMLLLSLTPLAANTVTWATLLKIHPQKAAQAVFLSTLFALFYIPLIISYFNNFSAGT